MNLLYANDRPGEYPQSYYAATATDIGRFAPLKGATRADVCIIGGGFTGLSAALHMAEAGLDVVLLEAHRVGFGASGRNGGQVGSGQRLEQDTLEKMLGLDHARQLWDLAQESKAIVKELVTKHAMPCTFHPGIMHACFTDKEVRHSHDYAEKLARDYGYDQIEPLNAQGLQDILPSKLYVGGDLDRGAGHLHPLNFAIGLAKAAAAAGVRIHEDAYVHHITHGARPVVQTGQGRVECDHVILACNGYLGGLDSKVAERVMPINNFVVATEPLGPRKAEVLRQNIAVADTKFVVNYWRLSDDDRLLFGGAESYGYKFPDVRKVVSKPLYAIYPGLRDVKIDYAWGGTLGITMNRMPNFARVAPNVLSASGYSGHGVAMATLAGRLLAEAVGGQAGRFDAMANVPIPRFPGGRALRSPLLVLGMTWFSLRDRLGF
ncbi:MAG: FAD-binding oxidoreductase [Albidovulum sp.]